MFRVLLADDERSVIEALRKSIPWEELGLEVVSTVCDGGQALKCVQEENVDIAVLDIRMPELGGLELCERIRDISEEIQMIIISGYAEFAYAQKALQFGVLGYCLKPLDYLQVMQYLNRAVQNLRMRRHMTQEADLPGLLMAGDEAAIRENLAQMGFAWDRCYVAVSRGEKLKELEKGGIVMRLGRRSWGYLMKRNQVERFVRTAMQSTSADWQGIGYEPEAVELKDIYGSLEECNARAAQYFIDEKFRICSSTDEDKANPWLDRIQKALKDGRWGRVSDMIHEIGAKGCGDFTVRNAQKLCNLIYTSTTMRGVEDDYYIHSTEQLEEEFGDFRACLEHLLSFMESRGNVPEADAFTNVAFMKLIRYVNENYRGEISLTSAAQALCMNPNYVSQLFKKESGTTFVRYIIQKRLEDAKELLVTTQKPVTDIALAVGFNDTLHFMKTFKKYVGMTPGQYRGHG